MQTESRYLTAPKVERRFPGLRCMGMMGKHAGECLASRVTSTDGTPMI